MRSIRVLSTVAAIGTFFVMVLGEFVHLTGASTSIPDWPLAFGRLVPEMTPLVFWEWSHRLSVLIVFVTAVALIVSRPGCRAGCGCTARCHCDAGSFRRDRRNIDPTPDALGVPRDRACLRDAVLRQRGRPGVGRTWLTWGLTGGQSRGGSPRGRPERFPEDGSSHRIRRQRGCGRPCRGPRGRRSGL